MNTTARTIIIYVVVVGLLWAGFSSFLPDADEPESISLTKVAELLDEGQVASARIFPSADTLELRKEGVSDEDPADFSLRYPGEFEDELVTQINSAGIELTIDEEPVSLGEIVIRILPWIFFLGFMFFIFTQMQGGGNRVMQFGKAKAKQVSKDQPKVTFDDVAGIDEAVEELREIKDFLQNPAKFRALGAKIPKGVLLFGAPGTGKTLLARAVAGEAGVPFFSISGSDFVEMFVGVGASRVRDLFEQAKAQGPAIVFIDEIDAVGRHRGAGMGGGHDEREQTLNQLLVELDGFDTQTGVIVLASTNRPDILDPALLRPGRFDRQIVVDRADVKGREAILKVHASGKPLADDVDLALLAKRTPGFTGADLANLINEAALFAARTDKTIISMYELEEAIERVIAGPERKSRIMSEDERRLTAYHEGGHALVGFALPNADPIHKVTIIPRGRAGGYTLALPEEDRNYQRRSEMVDQLAMLLGGRTAEEIIFLDPSTGASNDIEKATGLAKKMVMEYGMSEKLGPIQYGKPDGEVFLGRDYSRGTDMSENLASDVDEEIRTLITQAHDEAFQILTNHIDALHRLAAELLEKETLGAEEIIALLHDVPKWEHVGDGSGRIQPPTTVSVSSSDGVAAALSDPS